MQRGRGERFRTVSTLPRKMWVKRGAARAFAVDFIENLFYPPSTVEEGGAEFLVSECIGDTSTVA